MPEDITRLWGIAVSPTIENGGKNEQKCVKTGTFFQGKGTSKGKNMSGTKGAISEGKGNSKRITTWLICDPSGHLGLDCPSRGTGTST